MRLARVISSAPVASAAPTRRAEASLSSCGSAREGIQRAASPAPAAMLPSEREIISLTVSGEPSQTW